MLAIYVTKRRHTICTADNQVMRVRSVYVRENREFVPLQEAAEFSHTRGVRFILKSWRGLKRMRGGDIGVVERAVSRFLETWHTLIDESYDCYAFVNDVYDLPRHRVNRFHEHWELYPFHEEGLHIGNVVFLTTPHALAGRDMFHHAAVYLGDGLYISVYGAGGHLEIASLRDMKVSYRAKEVYIAVPFTHRAEQPWVYAEAS